jgi:hypothetical protein
MPLADLDPLLGILAEHFGEPVTWRWGCFLGRLRIDPFTVPLSGTTAGVGVTETWLYAERAAIPRGPGETLPDVGAVLAFRDRCWEIVEAGDDDLGERAFRLIPFQRDPAELDPDAPDAPPLIPPDELRRPGRPSRRDEIERAYASLAPRLPPDASAGQVFAAIRRALTGRAEESPGLSDQTLRKIVGRLRPASAEPLAGA